MFGAPCIDCDGTGDGSKRRPGERRTMIDDMQGIYSHVSDAYRAGQREGREEFFRHALAMLSGISSKWETARKDDSFATAEECCRALRHIKAKLDAPKTV